MGGLSSVPAVAGDGTHRCPGAGKGLGEQMGRGGRLLRLKEPARSYEGGWGGGDGAQAGPRRPAAGQGRAQGAGTLGECICP